MLDLETLQDSITVLLNKAGFSSDIINLEKCIKGGNNRTYRLETRDGVFAVKNYFRQIEDKRDRLKTEFAFLSYAKQVVPDFVPTPFSFDEHQGIALYEFVDGVPFDSLTQQDVELASEFFCRLNQEKERASDIATASEACFSLQNHIDLIANRISELEKIPLESQEDKQAQLYIQQLKACWNKQVAKINRLVDTATLQKQLDKAEQCLSPSDFGFHNALRMRDGSIRFLDFEYAGWDDPAKMTGDFFAQLAVPVPGEYFPDFVQQTLGGFQNGAELIERANLLRYVYQVKWCCIALNIFLPMHLARRKFANPQLDVTEIKQQQLQKVAVLINKLEESSHGHD